MVLGKKRPQESGNCDIDVPELQEGEMAEEEVHWAMKAWSKPDGGNDEPILRQCQQIHCKEEGKQE